MSRLDDLLAMRARIETEIKVELDAQRRVDALMAEVGMKGSGPSPIETTLTRVADLHSITVEDITGDSRRRECVQARHIAAYLLRGIGMSYPSIGRTLGCDHTTVMHGVRRVETTTALKALALTVMTTDTEEDVA